MERKLQVYTQLNNNQIKIEKNNFNLVQTLECGQVFSYELTEDGADVLSADKLAHVKDDGNAYILTSSDIPYFINYFDLETDYDKIKAELGKYDMMTEPIKFGSGIRILKQDTFETIISFIVSANNNINRIKGILNRIRHDFGQKIENYFTFPNLKQLGGADKEYFKSIGAGYRAEYLEKTLQMLQNFDIEASKSIETPALREKLMSFQGVGRKVADCILLFGYSRQDVFPVDTWIQKMYSENFTPCEDRTKISNFLMQKFGCFSGYAQQYLFYYKRSGQND